MRIREIQKKVKYKLLTGALWLNGYHLPLQPMVK